MTADKNLWEKRYNPLRGDWIVYAAHRNARPWDGESLVEEEDTPSYLDNCYLCPGNKRSLGNQNPNYSGIFVFDNDFPVVSNHAPQVSKGKLPWQLREKADGFAKVICYSPDHSKTMTDLDINRLGQIFKEWQKITEEAIDRGLKSILIFENKGSITGVSNLHPHCQVYATDFVFKHTADELRNINNYDFDLFEKIIEQEKKDAIRIVEENDFAIAFIPYFGRYPYEVMLFPKRKVANLSQLRNAELEGIASVYMKLMKQYDLLYKMSFPYVMSVMQAPLDLTETSYHMYFHFQPPLRSPSIKKHLAGPEIGGGNYMADTLPEISAQILRDAK